MPSAALTDSRWLCLPAMPESAGRCREFVRSAFAEWGLVEGLDDALLLVSELSSNVVRHARTPMVLCVAWMPVSRTVRVSVRDNSMLMPAAATPPALAESGHGLVLVRSIARHWGVQRLPVGKLVWFELRTDRMWPGARSDADGVATREGQEP